MASQFNLAGMRLALSASMKFPFFKTRTAAAEQKSANGITVDTLLLEVRQQKSECSNSEIIIDLTNVQEISSQELNALVRLHLAIRENEGRIVLANASETIRETLHMTRVDRTFEVRSQEAVS